MNTTEAIEAATVALHTWECGCEWGYGNHDEEGGWEGNRFVQRATIAVSALMEPGCEECDGSGRLEYEGLLVNGERQFRDCPSCNGKGTRRRVLVEVGGDLRAQLIDRLCADGYLFEAQRGVADAVLDLLGGE